MASPSFFDCSWQAFSAISPPPPISTRQQHSLDNKGEHSGRLTAHTSPLTEAIANGNAVVYVGAGASKAAGLPDWREFLKALERESRAYSQNAAISIQKRILEGDYLVAAEMLQNVFGNKLQDVTHRVFGKVSVPTPIHRAIASIPFSLAVTTNYDCLLETAYHFSVPRLTWQNPYDVLQNVRSGIFCVLKLHGDYAVRESVVLARSHYRDLLQVNYALLNSLRMLLATRTFLFVGVSFSDPDLLALMDEAKSLYGDVFGPHYAIFPENHFDPEYSEVLERSYNIRTIVAPPLHVPSLQCDITGGVAALLYHIGGISSHTALSNPYRHGFAQFLQDPSSKFQPAGERIQVGWLLKNLVLRLGVPHGYVSMCDSSMPEHRILYRNFEYEVTDEDAKYSPAPETPEALDSIQSCLFQQRKIEDDYIHLSDVDNSSRDLDSQGFLEANYTPRYKDAGSALCVPVYVDGHRSGVVTLEADAGYMFSKYHYKVARQFADRIGSTRYESNRLADSAVILKKYSANPFEFQEELRRSRDLDDLDLQCLLYQIDPYAGKLSATLRNLDETQRNGNNNKIVYDFEEAALASEAFRERRTIRISDTKEALKKHPPVIAKRGIELFDIEGPVCAFPVHVRGYTAGVFVGWSGGATSQDIPDLDSVDKRYERIFKTRFWRGMERARRLLHVIANEPIDRSQNDDERSTTSEKGGRAAEFLEAVAETLQPIDEGKSWGSRVKDRGFRKRVIDGLLKTIVGQGCGLKRVRLFTVNSDSQGLAKTVCIASRNAARVGPPGHSSINGYRGIEIKGRDKYIEHTMRRAEFDPYARLQDHVTLGGSEDSSAKLFHKAPERPWIVAPIGPQHCEWENGNRLGMTMCGYLAGDDFYWDQKKQKMIDDSLNIKNESIAREEFVFKRYCLDFASDILSILMYYEASAQDKPDLGLRP
ncbi:SIR2 family NAD-dependent protein deacylase [Gimesia fumaroli]|uniref:Uncharacterized protein n=1 Tax=Gimesia fumaroli TaxID=2527976 RepID=A0A518IE37_9PLAN|nr:SIR2 family protein [Gimesia fumaroli]QDV51363.1 hypothetical protein Enr17x_34190 [Gimesia fumaroli]